MRSLEELAEIRDEVRKKVDVRDTAREKKIVVGMGTSGIAAGAREVLQAIVEEVANQGLEDVIVAQVGDTGSEGAQPVVEVFMPESEKVTYVGVTPDKVAAIITQHVVGGKQVEGYATA